MNTNRDTFRDKKTFCTIILIIYLLNILLPSESTTFLYKTSIAMMVRCLVVERNDELMSSANNHVPTWWSIVWCACGEMSILHLAFLLCFAHSSERLVVPIPLVPKSYRSQFVSRRASGQDASGESAFWPMVYQRW